MNNIRAIVFDLYGTLYDVHSVAVRCEAHFPQRGREVSMLWRQKQLEYTWLRSLMGQYADFEKVTEDALVFTCRHLKLDLDAQRKGVLSEEYLRILPFAEVPVALRELNAHGVPLAILSNGSKRSIDAVVRNSGLHGEFAQLISVEDVQVFKPDAKVYELAERRLHVDRSAILFVSSNAWDVTGARHFGYPVCWVNRGGGTFDEMGQRPDYITAGVDVLARAIAERRIA